LIGARFIDFSSRVAKRGMGEGKGYGKVILFNEHFVVYGIPCIVSSIDRYTTCRVERTHGSGWIVEDLRPSTPGYKEDKLEQQKDSINRILAAMNIEPRDFCLKITFGGNLVAASGIGASAASCVALARALSDEFNLNLNDDRINEIAYEGEKAYHGSPSGVDNAAATYGGVLWFIRGNPPTIERLRLAGSVEILMADTGIVADTSKVVASVRERMNREKEKFDKIFAQARELAYEAREALLSMDLKKVGELMIENHRLLQEIGVSSRDLDRLVEIALDAGALGAKMTGGGWGGNIVALAPGEDLQEKVAQAIEKEGYKVLKTKIW